MPEPDSRESNLPHDDRGEVDRPGGLSYRKDRVLRAALGRTPDCLPVEKLAALDDAGRVHVEGCAYCRNELAMLTEFEEAAVRPDEASSLAWIQGELARRNAAPVSVQPETLWQKLQGWWRYAFPSRGWQMVPVAAALLVIVGGGMYLRQGSEGLRPSTSEEQVWRSGNFAALAPKGEVEAAPADLRWEAVPGAARFSVRVTEVDRTEIWHADTAGTQAELPAAIRAQMTAGRTFNWEAFALDKDGHRIAETGLQTFHISATSH